MDTLAALSLLFVTMTVHRRRFETMGTECTDFCGEGDLRVGHHQYGKTVFRHLKSSRFNIQVIIHSRDNC